MKKTNQTFIRLRAARSVFHYLHSILSFQKSALHFINYFRISIKVYNVNRDVYLLRVRRYYVVITFESVVSMDRYMIYTYFNKGLPVSFKCKVEDLDLLSKKTTQSNKYAKKTTSYVSMFSCLRLTYSPLDTCRCRRHHC